MHGLTDSLYIVQEETDYEEEHIYNRLSQKQTDTRQADSRERHSDQSRESRLTDLREKRPTSPLTGSFPGGRMGGASQTRVVGRGIGTRSFSSSQVQT